MKKKESFILSTRGPGKIDIWCSNCFAKSIVA
jgi:hypothetical protein